jgi:hypothetical protein
MLPPCRVLRAIDVRSERIASLKSLWPASVGRCEPARTAGISARNDNPSREMSSGVLIVSSR